MFFGGGAVCRRDEMPLICAVALSYLFGTVVFRQFMAGVAPGLVFALAAAGLACALLFAGKKEVLFAAFLCAAGFFTAAFAMYADTAALESSQMARYIKETAKAGAVEKITGVVRTSPKAANGMMRFEITAERARTGYKSSVECRGRLMAFVPAGDKPGAGQELPRYGDRVAVEGRLSGAGWLDPDAAAYYRRSDVDGFIKAHSSAAMENLGDAHAAPFLRWGGMLRDRFSGAMTAWLNRPYLGIMEQMLFGFGEEPPEEIEAAFRATGVIHILVVSGQQVMMLLGAFMCFAFIWKRSRFVTFFVAGGLLVLYYATTGGGPSVTRALVMGLISLLCVSSGREYEPLEALAWAGLILMAIDPWTPFNAGAQLSFAACLGIMLIYPNLSWMIPRQSRFSQPVKWFLISLSAQAPLYPLLAYYFNRVSIISPISNVFIVPLAGAALPLGLAQGALGALWSGFGFALGLPLRAILWLMVLLVKAFAAVPMSSVYVAAPGAADVALYFAAVAGAVWLSAAIRDRRTEHITWAVIACGVPAALLSWSFLFKVPAKGMRVTYFDVGEGDSALIEAPCGKNGAPLRALVDGGGSWRVGEGSYDPGEKVVGRALRRRGVEALDAVVLTHPDADHLNGLLWIVRNIPVGMVIDAGYDPGTRGYSEFRRALREKGIAEVRGGEGLAAVARGCLEMKFLYPPRELMALGEKSTNDISQAFMLRFGDKRLLFPGDVGRLGENELLLRYRGDLKCDALKVPHHGSGTSSSGRFIRAAAPEYAIVSVGRANAYGHPSKWVLKRYERARVKVFRTDLSGDIDMFFPARGGDVRVVREFE